MQVLSSMTMTPPEPAMEPRSRMESKSMGQSRSFSVSMGALEPPGMMALIFRPLGVPPPMSLTRKSRGVPMGSS